jgi:hypothetical protein
VMSVHGMDTALRSRLIIEGASVSQHCGRVIETEFGRTIRCVSRPKNGTCVTYALGLLECGYDFLGRASGSRHA